MHKVSRRYFLSAAHCFTNFNEKKTSKILGLVGVSDYSAIVYNENAAAYSIQSIQIHEEYDSNTQNHDIALLKTDFEIKWTRAVGPACLPSFRFSGDFLDYKYVTVAGPKN